eukprot:699456-Pyramimonas_sp.AAC.1
MHHGNGLLDIGQFYDTIGWLRLGRAALRLDFPAEVLGLEIPQCMAPRCFEAGRILSRSFLAVTVHSSRTASRGKIRQVHHVPHHASFDDGAHRHYATDLDRRSQPVGQGFAA